MSRSKTGRPKLGSIPKAFKRLQNKSQKMKLKENSKLMITNAEGNVELRIRKTHSWHWL
nr:hypothetical protein [Bacteroidota bacterium]